MTHSTPGIYPRFLISEVWLCLKKDDVIRVVRVDPINIAWMPSAERLIGKVGVIRYSNLMEDGEVSVVEIDGRLHWLYNPEIEIDETNQKLEPGNLSGLFYEKDG